MKVIYLKYGSMLSSVWTQYVMLSYQKMGQEVHKCFDLFYKLTDSMYKPDKCDGKMLKHYKVYQLI